MTEKEFEERIKEVFITNSESMGTESAQEFFEKETEIPYKEFEAMKSAYIEQHRDIIIETIKESENRSLDAVSAIFERAFLFGFMLKALDNQD